MTFLVSRNGLKFKYSLMITPKNSVRQGLTIEHQFTLTNFQPCYFIQISSMLPLIGPQILVTLIRPQWNK